ncbi:MAG: hypothetical protein IB618_03315 [Candidatus Pacearchaeota archaeon]|nr:MAG: hypothetical protein IB618_03315 [Candidatus Pacearchaeota archaeon]
MNFSEELQELRKKSKKRNFDQTLDLIINLKNFDPRREALSIFVILPNISKKKNICAFLEHPSKTVDYVITKEDIDKISSKDVKKLVKEYDFFIANAKLMPKIASKFGKVLGSAGKMPDPKIGGVLAQETDETISSSIKKISSIVKIRLKEASIKIGIGKESMFDEDLVKNADVALETIIKALPKKEINVRSVLLKFTMSPPVKIKKQKK